MTDVVSGFGIPLVAVDKGHDGCLWYPRRPDHINTATGDMIDGSTRGLVQEWAACDQKLDDLEVQIRGLALISERLIRSCGMGRQEPHLSQVDH